MIRGHDSEHDSELEQIDQILAQSATLAAPTCPDNVHFIGIRHHSPRCATVVKQWIHEQRPDVVLIEAPSDIKPMLAQLLLPHTLPIALFSYRQERRFEHLTPDDINGNDGINSDDINSDGSPADKVTATPDVDYHGDVQTAQSWFPLLSFSPEWVAIQCADAIGADIDFMDLPHWSYRAEGQQPTFDLADTPRRQDRYTEVMTQLLHVTGCDNQDALWERWFESAATDTTTRLSHYFNLLRGDEVGSDEDQCREGYMASWVDYHRAIHPKAKIVVVCGGWHVNGIQRLLTPQLTSEQLTSEQLTSKRLIPDLDKYLAHYFAHYSHSQQPTADHQPKAPTTRIVAQGNYLIPIDFTRVERLTGYAAGMPSPQYYQWLFDADMQADIAFEQAMIAITQAIRAAKQPLSCADLVVWAQASHNLAQLRGLDNPYRQELLDGMLSGIINEALTLPPPWSSSRLADADFNHSDDADVQIRPLYTQDHPVLKLALTTLTGSKRGVLARDNPAPPLLQYVEHYLSSLTTINAALNATSNNTILNIMPTVVPRNLTLSYRHDGERLCLHALWQLKVLGISSVSRLGSTVDFGISASAQSPFSKQPTSKLATASERWQLHQNSQWEVELIEASRFGTTLHEASFAALREQLTHAKHVVDASEQIARISHVLTQVIQCGFGESIGILTTQLNPLLLQIQDRGAVSQLGKTLISLMQRGFYGHDIEALLAAPFIKMTQRLLWLLEGANTPKSANAQAAKQADILSIEVLKFAIEQSDAINAAALRASDVKTLDNTTHTDSIEKNLKSRLDRLDTSTMMMVLYRLTQIPKEKQTQQQPPMSQTLHGACIAAYFSLSNQAKLSAYFVIQTHLKTPYLLNKRHESRSLTHERDDMNHRYQTIVHPWRLVPTQLPTLDYIPLIKAIPIKVLGDFLLGLFALGRRDVMHPQQTELLRCLHQVINTSNDEVFLGSLPSLRQAFSWFPPQERYQISKSLALIMGLDTQQAADWQVLLRQRLPDTATKVAEQLTQAALLEQQTAICLHQLVTINPS